uniref:Uncharacterized protein n=1 Tax=Ditylenchus dipsaci TaxID=166011 RepID=A0A915DXY2_9BILA
MQSQIYKDMKAPPGKDEAGRDIPAGQKDQSDKMIQSIPMTHQQREMTNNGTEPIGHGMKNPSPAGNRSNPSTQENSTAKSSGLGNMGMIGLGAGALVALFAVVKMMPNKAHIEVCVSSSGKMHNNVWKIGLYERFEADGVCSGIHKVCQDAGAKKHEYKISNESVKDSWCAHLKEPVAKKPGVLLDWCTC